MTRAVQDASQLQEDAGKLGAGSAGRQANGRFDAGVGGRGRQRAAALKCCKTGKVVRAGRDFQVNTFRAPQGVQDERNRRKKCGRKSFTVYGYVQNRHAMYA